ncbi:MAG: signal peptidase I [Desulfopila sp.]
MDSRSRKKSLVREYIEAIVIAILLALFIRTFIVQAFKIPSGSMLPTLKIGDYLLVSKFSYGIRVPFTGQLLVPLGSPERGDVVVFRFPRDRSVDYIKRVVGLPGDTVTIKDKQVLINGEAVADPHAHFSSAEIVDAEVGPRDNFGPVTVPKGAIFVMGDNRDNSFDSRFWGFVDERDILGKAFILYWSWDTERPLLSADRFESVRWQRIGRLIH